MDDYRAGDLSAAAGRARPRRAGEAARANGSAHLSGVIDRRYPLAAIVDAYRYVETGQKTGIVVVDVVLQRIGSRIEAAPPIAASRT